MKQEMRPLQVRQSASYSRIAGLAVFITSVLIAGCASSTRVLMTADQAREAGVKISDIVAIDPDGPVLIGTTTQIVCYDIGEHSVENLLTISVTGIADVDVGQDGVPLVLGNKLHAFFAGGLVLVYELPGRGRRLRCYERQVYLVIEDSGVPRLLYRYDAAAKSLVPLMESDQPINAIWGVPGGCIIAVGDSLYKFFDDPGSSAPSERQVVFLCAVAGVEIVSVAADPSSQAVFFSDEDSTYVWANGMVLPFFPLGGNVYLREGVLVIGSSKTQQLVRIPRASSRVSEILSGLE